MTGQLLSKELAIRASQILQKKDLFCGSTSLQFLTLQSQTKVFKIGSHAREATTRCHLIWRPDGINRRSR